MFKGRNVIFCWEYSAKLFGSGGRQNVGNIMGMWIERSDIFGIWETWELGTKCFVCQTWKSFMPVQNLYYAAWKRRKNRVWTLAWKSQKQISFVFSFNLTSLPFRALAKRKISVDGFKVLCRTEKNYSVTDDQRIADACVYLILWRIFRMTDSKSSWKVNGKVNPRSCHSSTERE